MRPRNPVPAVGATDVRHDAEIHVVRRAVGTPLRSLPRHQSQPDDADRHQPGGAAVEDCDQYLQLLASGHAAYRHHVLLARRRQDDGAAGQAGPRLELQDSRMSAGGADGTATSTATAVPTSSCSARRVVSGIARTSTVARQRGVGYQWGAPRRPPGCRRLRRRWPIRRRRIPALGRRLVYPLFLRGLRPESMGVFPMGPVHRHPDARPTSTATASSDLVVYRPSDGGWYVRYSSPARATPCRWAYSGAWRHPRAGRLRRRRPD